MTLLYVALFGCLVLVIFGVIYWANGPGIPSEERDKVFRRFYRLDASCATPGSGLGLSLVTAIAELHRISVSLTDNEPGLKVTLRFPVGALS